MQAWRVPMLILLSTLAHFAAAGEITPLKSPTPVTPDQKTVLTIISRGARTMLTLAEIERLPMQQAILRTPWGMNGVYQGVLLKDLLAAYKLDVKSELEITALDGYVSRIPAAKLRGRALLATRFNGQPIPLANRGPLILLWPEEEEAVLKLGVAPHSWVWSIAQFALQ